MVELQFDIHAEITLNFIERFLQLYRLDRGLMSKVKNVHVTTTERRVCQMALYLGRHTLREAVYLKYKPS